VRGLRESLSGVLRNEVCDYLEGTLALVAWLPGHDSAAFPVHLEDLSFSARARRDIYGKCGGRGS
jgi:hypothetical protein